MSLRKIALWGACSVMAAMIGCDSPRVERDGCRDSGTSPMVDAGGDDDAGRDEDAGRVEDAGRDAGLPGDDAAPPDAGPPDSGEDAGPPDGGCTPIGCAPTECGVNLRDDGCGTLLDCGLCGIGGGCADDTGCRPAMECLTEAETAWTDGYCSRECRVDADCTASSHCAFRDPLTLIGTCVSNCTTDADCRAGYGCRNDDEDTGGSSECVPNGSGTGAVGDRCVAHGDCGGLERGFCINEGDTWREGYCSMTCSLGEACPTGTHCGFFDAATGEGVCLQNCTDDSGCRADGYQCVDGDADPMTLLECFPAATGAGLPGSACVGLWECAGGVQGACFGEDGDFRSGYCTRGCATAADCPSGSHCSAFTGAAGTTRLCTPNCATDADCRADGYTCQEANGVAPLECWPAGTGTSPPGGTCEGVWECAGGENAFCFRRPDWDFADGYCTQLGCTAAAGGCPAGSHCAEGLFGIGVCLDDCSATDPCRTTGYACYDTGDDDTVTECWTAATGAAAPGEPCRWITDCAGGEFGGCVLENGAAEGDEFPGGYCIQDCATRACPSGSVCFDNAVCLRGCTSDSNCRVDDGYACATIADSMMITGQYCLP